MYQALYRKYRPDNFNDVVGQDVIKKTIINEINNNKLSHAYLFCGPRGTGKTSIAKLIAKLINCENQKDGIPCGKCNSCENYKNNVDIVEIDAASNNGVEEIRELRSKVNLLPANSKYKVYIIDEVHMLSIGAFNALLKTLEEPPAHVIFILATTEINKIPITIVSRCQRFDFSKISSSQIYLRLKKIATEEKINITDKALEEISKLTDGGLRDAIGLLDKVISYTNEEITEEIVHEVNYSVTEDVIKKILNYMHERDINNYMNYIDELDSKGKDLLKLVDELVMYLRDAVIDKNDLKTNGFTNKDIITYINSLNDISNKMKNTNYPKILLETFILTLEEKNITVPKIEKKVKEEKNIKIQEESVNDFSEVKIETKEIEHTKEDIIIPELKKERVITQKIIEDKDLEQVKTIEQLKNVRVNNSLAEGNKNLLNELKSNWRKISEYSVNQVYGVAAGMLLDSDVALASDKNILVVFPYESMANRANNDIPRIEEILKLTFDKEYKFIALDNAEWNKVKKEYVKNIKNNIKYDYKLENSDYDILFNKKDDIIVDQAIEFFGSSVVQVM